MPTILASKTQDQLLFRPLAKKELIYVVLFSVCLHLLVLVFFNGIKPKSKIVYTEPVKLKVIDVPQQTSLVENAPAAPKSEPIKTKPKKPEQRKPSKPPKPNAKKIQGLTTGSLGPGESTIAVPLGNTLMTKDQGKRLTPEEIDALERDLSSDALLVRATLTTPSYTTEALQVGLEGKFVVDVYVNSDGSVADAEISARSIGYGMDEKILVAAKSAKFFPKKDAAGRPQAGWAEIVFYLEIP